MSGLDKASLLKQLHQAVAEGRVALGIEMKLFSNMNFPFFKDSDRDQFIYITAGLSMAGLWGLGWYAMGGVIAAAVLFYFGFWRGKLRARMRRRVHESGMTNLPDWNKCWGYSGLSLSCAVDGKRATVRSPDGDWAGFAAEHVAPRAEVRAETAA